MTGGGGGHAHVGSRTLGARAQVEVRGVVVSRVVCVGHGGKHKFVDEVCRLQQLVVDRDVPQADRRDEALLRLQRAHLFYPSVSSLQQDVQVQHSYLTAGITEGRSVESELHSATTGRVPCSFTGTSADRYAARSRRCGVKQLTSSGGAIRRTGSQ